MTIEMIYKDMTFHFFHIQSILKLYQEDQSNLSSLRAAAANDVHAFSHYLHHQTIYSLNHLFYIAELLLDET